MSGFTEDLDRARAAAESNRVPVLTIWVVPSGQENYPDVYVAVDGIVTWKPVNATHPEEAYAGPLQLQRGLECLEEALLPMGGPAVLTDYLERIS